MGQARQPRGAAITPDAARTLALPFHLALQVSRCLAFGMFMFPFSIVLMRKTPHRAPLEIINKNGGPRAAVFQRSEQTYFTPCISFWISGAIRNSSTPEPIRA